MIKFAARETELQPGWKLALDASTLLQLASLMRINLPLRCGITRLSDHRPVNLLIEVKTKRSGKETVVFFPC